MVKLLPDEIDYTDTEGKRLKKFMWNYELCVFISNSHFLQARVMATIGVTRGFGDHDLKVYNSNIYIKPFLSSVPGVSILFSPRTTYVCHTGFFLLVLHRVYTAQKVLKIPNVCKLLKLIKPVIKALNRHQDHFHRHFVFFDNFSSV